MEIPSDKDWHGHDPENLDEAYAYKNFFGKSFEEAVRLFEANAIHYQEDLGYMPGPVFGFYLKAFMAYLVSEAARGDCDGASCFVSHIEFKAEHDPAILRPYWSSIEPVLRYVVEHQDDYGAQWSIYGSFRSRALAIAQRGFELSFDATTPEVVPEDATIDTMAYSNRALSLTTAIQVLRNSGINAIDEHSSQADVTRVFGSPQKVVGGEHPTYGSILCAFLYDLPQCTLRVEFNGDLINRLTFMPPQGSSGVDPRIEPFLDPDTVKALSRLLAPPNLRDDGSTK